MSLFAAAALAQTAPVINAVVNAATFQAGALAPGTLITVFGTGLSSPPTASTVPLPLTLGGTVVLLNDQPIPLLLVSAGQINAQLPFLLPSGAATLAIRDSSGGTVSLSVSISEASPGIFTVSANGKGEAMATHSDSSLVERDGPVRADWRNLTRK